MCEWWVLVARRYTDVAVNIPASRFVRNPNPLLSEKLYEALRDAAAPESSSVFFNIGIACYEWQ